MTQHLNPRPPTAHGFVEYRKCCRCGTERPRDALSFAIVLDRSLPPGEYALTEAQCNWHCIDMQWCTWQAKGIGRLDDAH